MRKITCMESISLHICSRQELWSQQRQSLQSNCFANKHVSTATIAYSSNWKRCFLRCMCRDVTNRTVSWVSWLISDWVSELENCWGSGVVSFCCEKLVAEAREQFGNPKEAEHRPLEAATKQRLTKTWLWTHVCVCVCNTELWSVVTCCIRVQ
jgi:hypothetical protein